MEEIARTPKQLGMILRRRRRSLGMSQGTLGSRFQLRQATISGLENSSKDTRLGTLFDALAALGSELVVRPRTKGSAKDIADLF